MINERTLRNVAGNDNGLRSCGSVAVAPPPQIRAEIERLDKEISALGTRVERLAQKLEPVCRQEGPANPSPECCEGRPLEAPMASAISALSRRLGNFIQELDSITDRIEV